MEETQNMLGSFIEEVPTIWASQVTDRPTMGGIFVCIVGYSK